MTCNDWENTTESCEPCCEKDLTKCGTYTPIDCNPGTFQDREKDDNVVGDDYGKTNCCTVIATCAKYSCPAGKLLKPNAASRKCATDVSSCLEDECCGRDDTKCGGYTVPCKIGYFQDPAKNSNAYTDADRLRPSSDKICCSLLAACTNSPMNGLPGYQGCLPQRIKDPSKAATKCPGGPNTCSDALCCMDDTSTCGGNKVKCDGNDLLNASHTANTKEACCYKRPKKATCVYFHGNVSTNQTVVTVSKAKIAQAPQVQMLAKNVILVVCFVAALLM